MELKIPITERSRKYGYVFWYKNQDDKVRQFFGETKKIDLWVNNSYLGKKRIDWRYRRISLGWTRTRPLGKDITVYRLTYNKDGALRIVCQ